MSGTRPPGCRRGNSLGPAATVSPPKSPPCSTISTSSFAADGRAAFADAGRGTRPGGSRSRPRTTERPDLSVPEPPHELESRPHLRDGADLHVHQPGGQSERPDPVLLRSVATFDAFLGHATQSIPAGASAATARSRPLERGGPGREQHDEVQRRRQPRRQTISSGTGSRISRKPAGAPESVTRWPGFSPSLAASGVPL